MWLEKLQNISGNQKTLMTRNDYMWLLLLTLQSGKLTEPFDKLPPPAELPPISDIMPTQLFEEMLSSTDQNFSWIDRIILETNVSDGKGTASTAMPPYKFLDHQPQPINGTACYFSVFSKRSQ